MTWLCSHRSRQRPLSHDLSCPGHPNLITLTTRWCSLSSQIADSEQSAEVMSFLSSFDFYFPPKVPIRSLILIHSCSRGHMRAFRSRISTFSCFTSLSLDPALSSFVIHRAALGSNDPRVRLHTLLRTSRSRFGASRDSLLLGGHWATRPVVFFDPLSFSLSVLTFPWALKPSILLASSHVFKQAYDDGNQQ